MPPLSPSVSIWRYLTFAKFMSLLEFHALWMCRLGYLIDQFEGTLPGKTREALLHHAQGWKKVFTQPELQRQLDESADVNVRDGRAMLMVSCWFSGDQESRQMWDTYTSGGGGVAIRSTVGRLERAMLFRQEGTQVGAVEYIDFEQYDMGVYRGNQAVERAFLKQSEYAFENEVRLVVDNDICAGRLNPDGTRASKAQRKGPGRSDPNRLGLFLEVDLNVLIEEVVTCPGSAPWFSDLVRRLCARYHVKSKVSESSLS